MTIKKNKKGLSSAIWYIMVVVLAIIVIIVLATLFGKGMEVASNNTKSNINTTFTPIQCIAECNKCCSDNAIQDCTTSVSQCICDDRKQSAPGC